MKTLLLLPVAIATVLLSSFASATGTQLQTQDLGASNLTFSGTDTLSGSFALTGTFTGNNVLHNASVTNNFTASNASANAFFTTCYATVTVTTSATDRIRVWYSGLINNNSSSRYAVVSFLIDGAYDTGLSKTTPITGAVSLASAVDGSFSWVTTAQAAGTHNICFLLASNGVGTATACSSVPAMDTYAPGCQFGAEEVK